MRLRAIMRPTCSTADGRGSTQMGSAPAPGAADCALAVCSRPRSNDLPQSARRHSACLPRLPLREEREGERRFPDLFNSRWTRIDADEERARPGRRRLRPRGLLPSQVERLATERTEAQRVPPSPPAAGGEGWGEEASRPVQPQMDADGRRWGTGLPQWAGVSSPRRVLGAQVLPPSPPARRERCRPGVSRGAWICRAESSGLASSVPRIEFRPGRERA